MAPSQRLTGSLKEDGAADWQEIIGYVSHVVKWNDSILQNVSTEVYWEFAQWAIAENAYKLLFELKIYNSHKLPGTIRTLITTTLSY